MSFLTKHWRFTAPAAAVLCALLLGALLLPSASTPPQPEIAYVMPERHADDPSPDNTGGIPLPAPPLRSETEAAAMPTTHHPTTPAASHFQRLHSDPRQKPPPR